MIKKMISALLLAFVFFVLCPIFCCAENDSEEKSALDEYSQSINESVNQALDDDVKESMTENGINGSELSEFGFTDIVNTALNQFSTSLSAPLRTLGRLAAVIILTAFARSLSAGGSISYTFGAVSVLGSITLIYSIVYEAFSGVCDYLSRLSQFMMSYIPIYASVTAASGCYTAGGSYYASSLIICEIIAFVSQRVIMPFLCVFLALSFTSSINTDMKFSSAAESIKNAVRFTLTALMTIFTGFNSLKTFSGTASDTAASKAIKFGASNFIPIIGGSVSEAYSAVYAGIGIIRSSVGTIGIIAVTFMLLKPLITLICVKITVETAKLISDLLGVSEISELLKSTGYAVSAMISTVLCFSMMFIISTALIMITAVNSAV